MADKDTLTVEAPQKFAMLTKNEDEWGKWKILKNLIIASITMNFLFSALSGAASLQSTINSRNGIGLVSQAVIYIFSGVSSTFLAKTFTELFSCKKLLAWSSFSCCPYLLFNLYVEWYTLIPAAVVAGTAEGVYWIAQCTYIYKISTLYSSDPHTQQATVACFMGVMNMFYLFSGVSGNLVSYFILAQNNHQNNSIFNMSSSECGMMFSENSVQNLDLGSEFTIVDKNVRFILMGSLAGLNILASVIIILFQDDLPSKITSHRKKLSFPKVIATLKLFKQRKQLLLIFLPLYCGLQYSFAVGDFTKVYVACAMGLPYISIVRICASFSSGLSSGIFGKLQVYSGRPLIMVIAAVANVFVIVYLLIWKPDPSVSFMFFILSSVWGIFDGIYVYQYKALYATVFPGDPESAFSCAILLASIGNSLNYAYSNYLHISIKLYILIIVFLCAQFSYIYSEVLVAKQNRRMIQKSTSDEGNHKT